MNLGIMNKKLGENNLANDTDTLVKSRPCRMKRQKKFFDEIERETATRSLTSKKSKCTINSSSSKELAASNHVKKTSLCKSQKSSSKKKRQAAVKCLLKRNEKTTEKCTALKEVKKEPTDKVDQEEEEESLTHVRKPPPTKFFEAVGYAYNFINVSKRNGEVSYWRCDKRHKGCRVRIATCTATNTITKVSYKHNHPPELRVVQKSKLRAIVKVRALQAAAGESVEDVLKASLLEMSRPISPPLNTVEVRNFHRIITRERKLQLFTPSASCPRIVDCAIANVECEKQQ